MIVKIEAFDIPSIWMKEVMLHLQKNPLVYYYHIVSVGERVPES